MVIVAYQVNSTRFNNFIARSGFTIGCSDWSCGIQFVDNTGKLAGYTCRAGISLLGYFISNTPYDHRWVVPVAQYLICQVTLVPFIEENMRVILGSFTNLPYVKCFVHNN